MNTQQIDKCTQAILAAEQHNMGLFDMRWNSFTSWQERSHTHITVSSAGKRSIDIFGLKKELKRTVEGLRESNPEIFTE